MNRRCLVFTFAVLLTFFVTPHVLAEQEGEAAEPTLEEAKNRFKQAEATLVEATEAVGIAELDALLGDVKSWPDFRHHRAAVAAAGGPVELGRLKTDIKMLPYYWRAARYLTEVRIELVRGLADTPRYSQEWQGKWIDSYGGRLRLVEQEDGIVFDVNVTRGPTSHLGHIAGVAERNGQLARFSGPATPWGEDDEDGPEVWLNFTRRGRTLELAAANAQNYHGARAYFDGRYVRVGPLTKKDVQQVRERAAGIYNK